MNFKENAVKIIENVMHPAINFSLVKLGLVRSYKINDKSIEINLAFPALNIPIKDLLINSLQQPLQEIGADVDIKIDIMTLEEVNKFFQLEAEGWKGM
jgi:ATP-binding protein involved in chromosome partitioning